MKAMLLAAGRGERMRPLTDATPKPLLEVGGKPLIVHLVERLVAAGLDEMVVNHAWLGAQIERALGDGSVFGARIAYSPEPEGALETGGGVQRALPLLGPEAFVVVSADLYTDYPFAALRPPAGLAHLVMVDNPAFRPGGDFHLQDGRIALSGGGPRLTYASFSVLRPALFEGFAPGRFPLAEAFRAAISRGQVTGERYGGLWRNVGNPQELGALDAYVRSGETSAR